MRNLPPKTNSGPCQPTRPIEWGFLLISANILSLAVSLTPEILKKIEKIEDLSQAIERMNSENQSTRAWLEHAIPWSERNILLLISETREQTQAITEQSQAIDRLTSENQEQSQAIARLNSEKQSTQELQGITSKPDEAIETAPTRPWPRRPNFPPLPI